MSNKIFLNVIQFERSIKPQSKESIKLFSLYIHIQTYVCDEFMHYVLALAASNSISSVGVEAHGCLSRVIIDPRELGKGHLSYTFF